MCVSLQRTLAAVKTDSVHPFMSGWDGHDRWPDEAELTGSRPEPSFFSVTPSFFFYHLLCSFFFLSFLLLLFCPVANSPSLARRRVAEPAESRAAAPGGWACGSMTQPRLPLSEGVGAGLTRLASGPPAPVCEGPRRSTLMGEKSRRRQKKQMRRD